MYVAATAVATIAAAADDDVSHLSLTIVMRWNEEQIIEHDACCRWLNKSFQNKCYSKAKLFV